MKKYISYLTTIVFVLSLGSQSIPLTNACLGCQPGQSLGWKWGTSAGGTGQYNNMGKAINVDKSGNSYVVGTIVGSATFGLGQPNQVTLNSIGNTLTDIFLAKYNSKGQIIWAKRAGNSVDSYNGGFGVASDNDGNAYITGAFENGSITFGNVTLTNSNGFKTAFLAKYDSSGNLLWAQQMGALHGPGMAIGRSLSISDRYLYITGYFNNPAIFGDGQANQITLQGSNLHYDAFIAKYDLDGNLAWAKKTTGVDENLTVGIATNTDGDAYLTGYFIGKVTFDNNVALTASNSLVRTAYIVKYDKDGTPLWAQQIGGDDENQGKSVAVDPLGNLYVTGFINGKSFFGSNNSIILALQSSNEYPDLFLAKYTSKGDLLWALNQKDDSNNQSMSVAIDGKWNVYVAGYFQDSITLTSADNNNSITLNSANNDNALFVAKYNENGNIVAADNAFGNNNNSYISEEKLNFELVEGFPVGLSGNPFGGVNVTTDFKGTALLDPNISLFSNNNGANQDILVAKLF